MKSITGARCSQHHDQHWPLAFGGSQMRMQPGAALVKQRVAPLAARLEKIDQTNVENRQEEHAAEEAGTSPTTRRAIQANEGAQGLGSGARRYPKSQFLKQHRH